MPSVRNPLVASLLKGRSCTQVIKKCNTFSTKKHARRIENFLRRGFRAAHIAPLTSRRSHRAVRIAPLTSRRSHRAVRIAPFASRRSHRAVRIAPLTSRRSYRAARIAPLVSRRSYRAARIAPLVSRRSYRAARIAPLVSRRTNLGSRLSYWASRIEPHVGGVEMHVSRVSQRERRLDGQHCAKPRGRECDEDAVAATHSRRRRYQGRCRIAMKFIAAK
jgi:hypothetical protein